MMTTTWVLIAQGSLGKILEVRKNGQEISLIDQFTHTKTAKKGIDINTDRQGRSFERAGSVRHAMDSNEEITDHERRVFAKEISDYLAKAHAENRFANLILVSSPNLLGDFRKTFPTTLQKTIKHELAKDLISQALKDDDLINKIRQDLKIVCF